jgi:hypothetical protein
MATYDFSNASKRLAPIQDNTYLVDFVSARYAKQSETSGWLLLKLRILKGSLAGRVFEGSIGLGMVFNGVDTTSEQLVKIEAFAKNLGLVFEGKVEDKAIAALLNSVNTQREHGFMIPVTIAGFSSKRVVEGYNIQFVGTKATFGRDEASKDEFSGDSDTDENNPFA